MHLDTAFLFDLDGTLVHSDGTITPQDLGMSWAVSKKKPDFVGKRSFTAART